MSSGATPAATAAPGIADVDRIAAMEDPVLRNLDITHCYHQLALACSQRFQPAASWCLFAVWASRQAGQTIRGEDLWNNLKRQISLPAMMSHPVESLWKVVLRAGIFDPHSRLGRIAHAINGPLNPFERASDAVARGNQKVFAEIAREFARYLEAFPAGALRDDARLEGFLAGLTEGQPPDGQTHLRNAFTAFYHAEYEGDPKAKDELVYLANLETALHEQIRVQPLIAESLEAPVEEVRTLGLRLAAVLLPGGLLKHGAVRAAASGLLGTLAMPVANFRRRLARRIITRALLTLSLPGGRVLRLSARIEDPYPERLRTIDNPELRRMLWLVDDCKPGTSDCGAEDWGELRDRMHYITRYFRTFHEDASLLESPFTAEQLAEIRTGRLPEGDLS